MRIETKTKVIADMVGILETIVTDSRIQATKDKFVMRSGDAANCAVITVTASSDLFVKYEPSDEEIAVDIRKLNVVLSLIDNSTVSSFYDVSDKKKFVVENTTMKAGVKLIDTRTIKPWAMIPELKYTAISTISGEDFVKGVRAVEKLGGEWVRFTISSGLLSMSYEDESVDIKREQPKTTLSNFVEGEAISLYSVMYLTPLLKYLEKSLVKVETGINYPMRLTFVIDKSCCFEMVLAPRIETGG